MGLCCVKPVETFAPGLAMEREVAPPGPILIEVSDGVSVRGVGAVDSRQPIGGRCRHHVPPSHRPCSRWQLAVGGPKWTKRRANRRHRGRRISPAPGPDDLGLRLWKMLQCHQSSLQRIHTPLEVPCQAPHLGELSSELCLLLLDGIRKPCQIIGGSLQGTHATGNISEGLLSIHVPVKT